MRPANSKRDGTVLLLSDDTCVPCSCRKRVLFVVVDSAMVSQHLTSTVVGQLQVRAQVARSVRLGQASASLVARTPPLPQQLAEAHSRPT
jgi:hypothetical protein